MLISNTHITRQLTYKYPKSFGRKGKILTKHRGGGVSTKKILIDFSRNLWNIPAFVYNLEKSSAHSYYLALLVYPGGILSYIPAPEGLKVGQKLVSGANISLKPGNNTYLKNLPLNIKIHNIEAFPGSGARYVRSAGMWAKLLDKDDTRATVLFKNGKKRSFSVYCTATLGQLSNTTYFLKKILYKAGQRRKLGFRPRVRGVAMNAVDHPHGGGKGKKSPKQPNFNFKRKLPKGKKTKKNV